MNGELKNWCPTCRKRADDPYALFCSDGFHAKPDRPTPAPGALPELPEAYQTVTHYDCDAGTQRTFGLHAADTVKAYARAYAEQCRAGVVVTDEMVERAVDAYDASRKTLPVWNDYRDVKRHMVRAALQSAFADDEGVRRG